MKFAGVGERLHGGVVAQHEIEHAGEKPRIARRRAQRLRTEARLGEKPSEPFGIAGHEGKRLDRHDLGGLTGVGFTLCH